EEIEIADCSCSTLGSGYAVREADASSEAQRARPGDLGAATIRERRWNMRRLIRLALAIVLCAGLARAGAAEARSPAQTPPPALGGTDAAPPSMAINNVTDNVGSAGANGCGGTCRSHGGCLHRICEWFTYRAAPAPHECRCRRTCAGCTPPLYTYFAYRYPPHGHLDAGH